MKVDINTQEIEDYAQRIAAKTIRENIRNKMKNNIQVIDDFQKYVDMHYALMRRVTALEEEIKLCKKKGWFRK